MHMTEIDQYDTRIIDGLVCKTETCLKFLITGITKYIVFIKILTPQIQMHNKNPSHRRLDVN